VSLLADCTIKRVTTFIIGEWDGLLWWAQNSTSVLEMKMKRREFFNSNAYRNLVRTKCTHTSRMKDIKEIVHPCFSKPV